MFFLLDSVWCHSRHSGLVPAYVTIMLPLVYVAVSNLAGGKVLPPWNVSPRSTPGWVGVLPENEIVPQGNNSGIFEIKSLLLEQNYQFFVLMVPQIQYPTPPCIWRNFQFLDPSQPSAGPMLCNQLRLSFRLCLQCKIYILPTIGLITFFASSQPQNSIKK